MPLQKQLIPVTLSGGIDTKKDAYQQGNTFDELENAVQSKTGKISKRAGFAIQTLATTAPADLTAGPEQIAYFGNTQVAITTQGLYPYDPITQTYTRTTGQAPFCTPTSKVLISSTITHTNPVCAAFGDYTFTAYSSGSLNDISFVFSSGETIIQTGTVVPGGTVQKLIVWKASGITANYFFLAWTVAGSSTLQVRRFSATVGLTTPGNSIATITTGITDVGLVAACVFDAIEGNNTCYFIYRTTANATVSKSWNPDNTSPTITTLTHVPTSCTALAVGKITAGSQYYMYSFASGCTIAAYNGATLTVTSPTITGANRTAIGFCDTSLLNSNNAILAVLDTEYAFLPANLLSTSTPISLGGQITSKPFSGVQPGVLIAHTDTTTARLQGVYVLAQFTNPGSSTSLTYSAKFLYGTAVPPAGMNTIACLSDPGTNTTKIFPALKTVSTTVTGGTYTFLANVGLLNVVFPTTKTALPMAVDFNDGLYYGLGILQHYDGQRVSEAGFHLYPDITSAVKNGAGVSFPAGTYQIQAVYSWRDNQGRLHESATSLTRTYVADGTEAFLSIVTKPLLITTKLNVDIDIYMTEKNGTVFYKIGSQTNASAISGTSFQASAPPIVSNSPLYTTGNIVDNFPPGNVSVVKLVQNRLWVNDTEVPSQVWYSKLSGVAQGTAFSDVFSTRIPSDTTVTAIGGLDDKVIFMTKEKIFQTFGAGPDNLGNNPYPNIQPVTVNVGCTEPRSVIDTEQGLFYQSPLGIYLLDRGLNSSFIGAPVELYNQAVVRAAILVAAQNQIRFHQSTGRTLVYDLYHKQWYTFTNQSTVGAVIVPSTGLPQYLNTSGVVLTEVTDGTKLEGATPISYKIRSTWFSMSGLQGFQRIYRILLLGTNDSQSTLQVSIYHDFKTSASETKTILAAGGGPSTPPDTLDNVWQYIFCPAQQKCETFQLLITDSSASGRSFTLSGLAFEIGALPRGVRTPADRRMT